MEFFFCILSNSDLDLDSTDTKNDTNILLCISYLYAKFPILVRYLNPKFNCYISFIHSFMYVVFSRTHFFMLSWQLPAFNGRGRPHTYEYQNIRMYR